MKKCLAIIGCAVVIFILGGVTGMLYSKYKYKKAMERTIFLVRDNLLYNFKNKAEIAYLTEPPQTGIYALESYIWMADFEIQDGGYTGVTWRFDILNKDIDVLLAYARLGKLYYKMGQIEKASQKFGIASQYSDEIFFKKLDAQGWLGYLDGVDRAAKKRHDADANLPIEIR